MGAWGSGSYDNDAALDWIYELQYSDDLSVVTNALCPNLEDEGYLEVDDGTAIIAAAEVVAALLDKPAADLPEEVAAWVDAPNTKSR